MTDPGILAYRKLVAEIDTCIFKLENQHRGQVRCSPGCSDCCVNLTVFRVEFDSILHTLKDELHDLNFRYDLPCGFLKHNLCTIYRCRPLICRTHGLPILYRDDNSKWQVDFCDKNFKTPGNYIFNADNTLNIEQLNLQLYMINQDYCLAHSNDPDQRIDLCNLVSKRKMFE